MVTKSLWVHPESALMVVFAFLSHKQEQVGDSMLSASLVCSSGPCMHACMRVCEHAGSLQFIFDMYQVPIYLYWHWICLISCRLIDYCPVIFMWTHSDKLSWPSQACWQIWLHVYPLPIILYLLYYLYFSVSISFFSYIWSLGQEKDISSTEC